MFAHRVHSVPFGKAGPNLGEVIARMVGHHHLTHCPTFGTKRALRRSLFRMAGTKRTESARLVAGGPRPL